MELKDLWEALDLGDMPNELDKEKAINAVKSKWIPKALVYDDEEIVNKILGKKLGSIETGVKRSLKNVLKDLDIEENILEGFKISLATEDDAEKNPILKIGGTLKAKIEELKKQNTGGKNDKKIEELEKKLDALKNEKTSFQSMLTQKEQEFEQFKKQVEGEKKSLVIGMKKKDLLSKLPLSEQVDEYKLKGFELVFGEKYKLNLDDDGNIAVLNKDGQRVQNEKGTGFASLEEVYKKELEEAKMLKKNNAGQAGAGVQRKTVEVPEDKKSGTFFSNLTKAEQLLNKMKG